MEYILPLNGFPVSLLIIFLGDNEGQSSVASKWSVSGSSEKDQSNTHA